jgi:hypothetical protein
MIIAAQFKQPRAFELCGCIGFSIRKYAKELLAKHTINFFLDGSGGFIQRFLCGSVFNQYSVGGNGQRIPNYSFGGIVVRRQTIDYRIKRNLHVRSCFEKLNIRRNFNGLLFDGNIRSS